MWTKEMFGTDFYHLIAAFIVYSMLGWLVESIYMSFCNKKLTNRGFAKGPFCPIYGFGAVIGYLLLRPLQFNYVVLYVVAAFSATTFEFLVGKMMIRIFGELWWDYNEKPFNYKGIICLESTVAWGFYGLGIVLFLHGWIQQLIDRVPVGVGTKLIGGIMLLVTIDYIVQLMHAFHVDLSRQRERLSEKVNEFRARWN